MNVQSAINYSQILQTVYDTWLAAGPGGLTGNVIPVPASPTSEALVYNVVQTLYANDLATDLSPQPPEGGGWKIIGIVAVNAADATDYVIAIRGTSNIWEWIQDAKFFPKPFTPVPGAGLTDDGFTVMYESFSLTAASNGSTFLADLLQLFPANAKLTVLGHSLGSSLATLLAIDLAAHSSFPLMVYTLASPRTGDLTFERVFNHTVPDCFRIVNRFELVPKTPPPLLYFHVGDEVELIPGSEVKVDVLCWHHLSTYVYMLAKSIGTQTSHPLQAGCSSGAGTQLTAASAGQPG